MINKDSKLYNRRLFLRSSTACIALPFLHSMTGSGLLATDGGGAGSPKSSSGIPKRLVFLPMGYGVNAENWFPSIEQPGRKYDLPPLVKAFEDLKGDISFIQNLKCARIPDPHAGSANFMTCIPANERKDRGFKNGVSCDQLAAEVLGKETRFDFMAMGSPRGADGHGGYASWGHNGKPVGLHRTMTDIYASLFGAGGKAQQVKEMLARDQSSLDALLSDARKLKSQIGADDRDRLDEYFTSIRNIEKRLAKAVDWSDVPYPKAPFDFSKVKGKKKHNIELVFDMMVAAIQTDSTRVMSYMLPTAAVMTEMNPHRMSHQAKGAFDPNRAHQKRDLAFSKLVAGFLRKLKSIKEVDGSSLLDHSLVAYGSCLRHGHRVSDGPLILAGHGGGGIKQGQNLIASNIPLANLWLSMIRHVGVKKDSFANSTGVIKEMGFV